MRIAAMAIIAATILSAACRLDSDQIVEIPRATGITVTVEPSAAGGSTTPMVSPTWPPRLQTLTPSATDFGDPESTSTTPTPSPTSEAPPPAPPIAGCVVTQPPGWRLVVIQLGQTIGRLAQCLNASVAEIVAVNCLPDGGNRIFAGDELFLPGVCAVGLPTPPQVSDRSGTPKPTPLPPPPSSFGEITAAPDTAAPGETIMISFAKFVPNSLLNVTVQPFSGKTATDTVCISKIGVGQWEFTIPGEYEEGEVSVTAEILNDESARVIKCGVSERGMAGETSGAGSFEVIMPSPTPTLTAIPTPTATETATPLPEPTTPATTLPPIEPTLTTEPISSPYP